MKLTYVGVSEKKIDPDGNTYQMITFRFDETNEFYMVFQMGADLNTVVQGLRDSAMLMKDGPECPAE